MTSLIEKPLMEFFVAGLVYGDFDVSRPLLWKGNQVYTRHEVENKHDPNALALHFGVGQRLGYVPKDLIRPLVAKVREIGGIAHLRVINIAPTNPTHRMVLVGVFAGRFPERQPVAPAMPRKLLI